MKQETVSGNGISWDISKSASRSSQITMPAPHRSVFLQAGRPSCRPPNSVKALKATMTHAVECYLLELVSCDNYGCLIDGRLLSM